MKSLPARSGIRTPSQLGRSPQPKGGSPGPREAGSPASPRADRGSGGIAMQGDAADTAARSSGAGSDGSARLAVRALRSPAPRIVIAAAAAVATALLAPAAFAQDGEAPPGPKQMLEKVVEIERLMKQAEQSLARATSDQSAREAEDAIEKLLDEKSRAQTGKSADQLRKEASGGSAEAAKALERLLGESRAEARSAADAVKKLLDEKARAETGKSAEELRKLAEGGSTEAAEALRRLTEEASKQSSGASEGVRKLLESTQSSGKQASEGIEWILRQAQSKSSGGGGGGGGHDPKDEKDGKKPEKPKDGQKKEEPNKGEVPPPESNREKPKNPEFEKWLAELPPMVRKAYETQDWDSVPPRWREVFRAWTRKINDDLEGSDR